jgi:hypothetical protein
MVGFGMGQVLGEPSDRLLDAIEPPPQASFVGSRKT